MSDAPCTKRRFADVNAAVSQLEHAHSKGRKQRWSRLRAAYLCDRCGWWHLSSQPTADPRRRDRVEYRARIKR